MISSDVRLSADEDPQTSTRAAITNDRSTYPPCAHAVIGLPLYQPAARPRQRLQSRLYCRDVLLDLRNRQPAVKAHPGLQVSGKSPAMDPQLFKRLAVFHSCVAIHNQLNRTRHDATPQKHSDLIEESLVRAARS